MSDDRRVTLRRIIEQAIHCLVEADSVLKNSEDPRCARDDALHALELIRTVIVPGVDKIVQASESRAPENRTSRDDAST